MGRKKEKEWVVSGWVSFTGATCIVSATDREDAIRKAKALDSHDGIETNMAELVGWNFDYAEPNE